MQTHAVVSVVASPASGKGALDGFAATCSCGFVVKVSTLAFDAQTECQAHADYMNRKEAAARK